MSYFVKAFKWAYGDSVKYLVFMFAMAAFVGFLMTLIAYPVETITALVLGFGAIALFLLFSEWR